jgi:EpsI family protein
MQVSFKNIILLLLMLVSAGLASMLKPTISMADERPPIVLKAMIPRTFGDWQEALLNSAQIVDPQTQQKLDEIYSQTLSRTYVNSQGYVIMLSIAYGANQSDALQLHKPEVCYPAQGFALISKRTDALSLGDTNVPATRLMTTLQQRQEPVTYWTVIGDHPTHGSVDKKVIEMKYALKNRIPDGMLIRVSSIDAETDRAYKVQSQFAQQMIQAIPKQHRFRFSGVPGSVGPKP